MSVEVECAENLFERKRLSRISGKEFFQLRGELFLG